MTDPKRGDIVRVSFRDDEDQPEAVMDGPHPAVVLQNDGANRDFDHTVVVPLTTGSSPDTLYEVKLSPPQDGVDEDSLAQLTQIMVVSIPEQIKDVSEDPAAWKDGEISSSKLNNIENKLAYVLGI